MSEKPLLNKLQGELEKVIDRYRDQGISYGEAVGAIELVKLGLWDESVCVEDDDEFGDDDLLGWNYGSAESWN